jgi:hypothetical protein
MSIQICFYPGFSISLTFVCVCLVQLLFIELITTTKKTGVFRHFCYQRNIVLLAYYLSADKDHERVG